MSNQNILLTIIYCLQITERDSYHSHNFALAHLCVVPMPTAACATVVLVLVSTLIFSLVNSLILFTCFSLITFHLFFILPWAFLQYCLTFLFSCLMSFLDLMRACSLDYYNMISWIEFACDLTSARHWQRFLNTSCIYYKTIIHN